MAGFLNWLKGSKKPVENQHTSEEEFKAGQIWNYKTRAGEENSKLTILKVETYEAQGVVIHVALNGLRIKNSHDAGKLMEEAGHIPFSKEAILNSITNLDSEGNALPDFMEGYLQWKEAFDAKKGGVFSVNVSEAVKFLEEAMSNARPVND
jgi:hypothetical protein